MKQVTSIIKHYHVPTYIFHIVIPLDGGFISTQKSIPISEP
ncbi:MAG: hypothetical protein VYC72_03440 [Verrucomicrobiota bacterium]|nr:hypothetical protein [Verrucomicrobiota bacterium]